MRPLDFATVCTSPDVRSLNDVRWVMFDLHGGEVLPLALKRAAQPEKRSELSAAIHREKDTGARQTVDTLLQRVSGGLAVHVKIPRLLIDLNRAITAPSAPHRHSLHNLGDWLDLSGENGAKALQWAQTFYEAVRGPHGVIASLHDTLPKTVPFWDFHTYDVTSPDGTVRPKMQLFSTFEGEAFIPRGLCAAVAAHLTRQRDGLELSKDTVGIDEPYTMFDGCLLPALRGRTLFASEIRKDLFGPDGMQGRAEAHQVSQVASRMASVIPMLQHAGRERFIA